MGGMAAFYAPNLDDNFKEMLMNSPASFGPTVMHKIRCRVSLAIWQFKTRLRY